MDNSQKAATIFNKYATEYQNKFMDVSQYHSTFDIFLNTLQKPNSAILELACGPGNITKYLLSKMPNLQITGTDLSPNMIHLAKQNNPQADFRIMDCRDLSKETKMYDGIMAGFCLPYLTKVEAIQLISDASAKINSGGALYLSTMEDENSKSGMRKGSQGDEIYMNFHEATYLVAALEKNGLHLIHQSRIQTEQTDGSTNMDLILIATVL